MEMSINVMCVLCAELVERIMHMSFIQDYVTDIKVAAVVWGHS